MSLFCKLFVTDPKDVSGIAIKTEPLFSLAILFNDLIRSIDTLDISSANAGKPINKSLKS